MVGVTGSIACIKTAMLIRSLTKSGCEVKVMMTNAALNFIQPLTFSALTGYPVSTDFSENKDNGSWVNHVHLALWADAIIIAPCSAHTLAKMTSGHCDNFLMATYMSARCPVFIAPAMDHDMFLHAGTQSNLKTLSDRGHILIDPQEGSLASGLEGKGRMAEPEEIYNTLLAHFSPHPKLLNKKILITAGPTQEPIDPVRFISNHSSGKMGYALAERAAEMGAQVTLVSGPTHLTCQHPNITKINVITAAQMADAAIQAFVSHDIAILSAAVADYTPEVVSDHKIKKSGQTMRIDLKPTIDIAKTLGQSKLPNQLIVGFALETENLEKNALEKKRAKNMDIIVANDALAPDAGFGGDNNTITMYFSQNRSIALEPMHKTKVAQKILETLCDNLP
ncbi:MAG: bifunctional phosphopantothenoylcysteine decarboxylase/phosphopantothenate--cysteine ligase CoaBC [Bacteroidota bacterium]